jgi:hypothetical protein
LDRTHHGGSRNTDETDRAWDCDIDPLDGVLLHEHESTHATM